MRHHLTVFALGIVLAVIGVGIAFASLPMWRVHEVPWGLLVALYEFIGVIGAGSAILASILILIVAAGFYGVEAEKASRLGLILAVACLLTAGFTVALKSGFPETIIGAFFSVKTDSAIGRMLILLPLLVVLTIATYLATVYLSRVTSLKSLLAALTAITAVLAYANAGSVFQSMTSIPLWHATPMTALFLAGAIAWGAGAKSLYLLAVERRVSTSLARLYGAGIALGVLAYTAILYFTSLGYTGVAGESWSKITESTAYSLFLPLGFLIPLVLGLFTMVFGDVTALAVSAVTAIIGGFLVHTLLVVVPQTLTLTGFKEIVEIQYHLARDELVGAIGALILLVGLLLAGAALDKMLAERGK